MSGGFGIVKGGDSRVAQGALRRLHRVGSSAKRRAAKPER